ncbi:hypothetical protein Tco_0797120 [Tanacetum coccineum]
MGDDGEGLYVRGRTNHRDSRQLRGKSRSKSRGGRLKCYICQSEDHLKRNYPKNNRKKSTGYVKKDEKPSSSGSTYDYFEVEFKRISLTGFRNCTSRSRYRSISKQTTRYRNVFDLRGEMKQLLKDEAEYLWIGLFLASLGPR